MDIFGPKITIFALKIILTRVRYGTDVRVMTSYHLKAFWKLIGCWLDLSLTDKVYFHPNLELIQKSPNSVG